MTRWCAEPTPTLPNFSSLGLALAIRNEVGERLDAALLAGAQRIDAVAGLADRFEIAKKIDVRLRLHRGIGLVRACGLQQRVAIRIGLLDALSANLARSARDILDDQRLAERLLHAALRDPHRGVGGPARAETAR